VSELDRARRAIAALLLPVVHRLIGLSTVMPPTTEEKRRMQ
jgi:hypothetical protein